MQYKIEGEDEEEVNLPNTNKGKVEVPQTLPQGNVPKALKDDYKPFLYILSLNRRKYLSTPNKASETVENNENCPDQSNTKSIDHEQEGRNNNQSEIKILAPLCEIDNNQNNNRQNIIKNNVSAQSEQKLTDGGDSKTTKKRKNTVKLTLSKFKKPNDDDLSEIESSPLKEQVTTVVPVNKGLKRKSPSINTDFLGSLSADKSKRFRLSLYNNMSVHDYRPQMDTNLSGVSTSSGSAVTGDRVHNYNLSLTKNNNANNVSDEVIQNHQNYYHSSNTTNLTMATLCNIGNTCYLNSVIYTLRFAPYFLHNLHHLIEDLNQVNTKSGQTRIKSSSLGRNMGGLVNSNTRSWSNKDLASLGNNAATSGCDTSPKSNRQIATEKLHDLYQNLHRNETVEATEPFHADTFLHAIQDVSSIFEGNQQQDAHEFLMCILDSIRETCQSLTKVISDQPDIIVNGYVSVPEQTEIPPIPPVSQKMFFFSRKSKKKEEKSKNAKPPDSPLKENNIQNNSSDTVDATTSSTINSLKTLAIEEDGGGGGGGGTIIANNNDKEKIMEKIKKLGLDFFTEDFEGVTVSTTKCLSCETITEQKESMIDIAVPISGYENLDTIDQPHLFFQNSCITKEYFRGENKYRCEQCFGYTEAIRSISFEILPRLLIIQLKRFSGGMEKINSYIPTPFTLNCFCVKCFSAPENEKQHIYKLYSVITHVGATMSVGHYIAYTCSLDIFKAYVNCPKDKYRREQQQSKSTDQTGVVVSNNEKNSGLMKKKLFSRSKASSSGDVTKNIKNNINGVMNKFVNGGSGDKIIPTKDQAATPATVTTSQNVTTTPCPGLLCCGVYNESIIIRNSAKILNGGGSGNGVVEIDLISDDEIGYGDHHHHHVHHHHHNSNNSYNLRGGGGGSGNRGGGSSSRNNTDPTWYMCDDDKIKSMTQDEFENLLSPNNKVTITPYLLFYARVNNNVVVNNK